MNFDVELVPLERKHPYISNESKSMPIGHHM
jgi:hypothetical protein